VSTVKYKNEFLTALLGATGSDIETMIILAASSMDALYDNSKAFDTFLRKQGMVRILRKADLKMRIKHTIVPHVRIRTYSLARPL
jgi:hypothetical protein